MDYSMKGKIMTGMIVGAFLLALLAVIGSSWMTAEEDGMEANYSLSEAEVKAEMFGESMTIEIGVVQEGGSTERNTFLCEFD